MYIVMTCWVACNPWLGLKKNTSAGAHNSVSETMAAIANPLTWKNDAEVQRLGVLAANYIPRWFVIITPRRLFQRRFLPPSTHALRRARKD